MSSVSSVSGSTPIAQFSNFNGIDFNAIITAIMQQDSVPLTNLQNQQSAYQAQGSALTQLGGDITTMETDITSLQNPSAFQGVQASSNDTSVVTATSLNSGSTAGNYDLEISQLAQSQVTASTSSYSSSSATVATGGSISFTINGQTTAPIDITSATSLSQLTSMINAQNLGVTASVVNTGSANLLVISSTATGSDSGFTINNSLTNSSGSAVTFAANQSATSGNMQNAKDALFTVNGISIDNASNTISNAVPGVSVTLQSTGSATVSVTPSYSGAESMINNVINDFNTILTFYGQQETTDSNGDPMPLDNDPSLRQTMASLNSIFNGLVNNGSGFTNFAQVGIEFNSNGQLQFDQSTFESAMASNPSGVQEFFQGSDGTGGVLATLQDALQAVDPITGAISAEQQGLNQAETSLAQQITDEQTSLAALQQSLQNEYIAADNLMTQLNSQTSAISALSSSSGSSSSSSSSKSLTSSIN